MRIAVRQPEPLQANAMPEGFKAYAAARRGYARERSEAGLMLRQRIDAERKQLAERHQRERTEVLDGRWRGQGEALNALRSVLAAQQAGERAGMRERHRTERERLRARYGGRAAFPDLEHWLRERGGVDLAEQWRFRHGPRQLWLSGPFGGQEPGRGEQKAQARDIRDFEATVCGSEVRYARSGAVVGAAAFVAFVDRGRKIEQHDRDEGSVLAALQLAQAKWPTGFEVYGDQRYRTQCVWLAAEHGLRLNNAELAPALASARETLRLEREREERQREASRSITPEPPPQRGPSL
jgi:Large polyvalent protein-associated domain 7